MRPSPETNLLLILAHAAIAGHLGQLRSGIDGLVLAHGQQQPTFLPQVWNTLPDPQHFMAQLKRKAGLSATFWDDQITHHKTDCWLEITTLQLPGQNDSSSEIKVLGHCPHCQTPIAGRFGRFSRPFGAQHIPLQLGKR